MLPNLSGLSDGDEVPTDAWQDKLIPGHRAWKAWQAEREAERKRGWIPMALSMQPPLHPKAAVWEQEMLIAALGTPIAHDVLLRAELRVDRDIVHMFDEARLQYAEIAIERRVEDHELWNMQVRVWNRLAKLYRDMAATIDELFSQFDANDDPDLKKQQDAIDKYVSHKHYYTAMGLAVKRVFAIASDSPPQDNGYMLGYDEQNDRAIKNLALNTFKQRWYIKAGEAAVLEAVRRHLATMAA